MIERQIRGDERGGDDGTMGFEEGRADEKVGIVPSAVIVDQRQGPDNRGKQGRDDLHGRVQPLGTLPSRLPQRDIQDDQSNSAGAIAGNAAIRTDHRI